MATQNFRVKNGLEVGSATTITDSHAHVDSTVVVTGISTFESHVYIGGSLTLGAGGGGTIITDDIVARNVFASGLSTFVGAISGSDASFSGNVTVGGLLKYEDVVNVDSIGIATARSGLRITGGGLDVVGVSTFNDSVDLSADLDVDGHTELDALNVSGVSTFVGVTTTQSNSFVGGDLNVYGDAKVVGVLTVGSGTITIDGDTNTINIGTGATLHTTTVSVNQLEVAGIATFAGNIDLNADLDISGNLDVDGHTELDALNVSGIATLTSAVVTGDLTVGGVLKYEDVVNVDSIGIATARSGLRITGGGLDVVGVATFNNGIDGDLNALGKTYYVATTGSDSNSGDNINEPYLTIAQALSVATNGDIINISAGTYEETCPLTVPRGVTVKGSGLRSTTIKPTDATKTNNIFELNDVSTVEDFTVRNSYYDSSADTGYAFAYATGIAITSRSPYIQRVTVLNSGSTVTSSDPYGYDTPDAPPTTYLAGRGAKVDGRLVASNSLEAGMLFNEVTFFTPNNKGIVLTNGARAEYLNCFHYFASQAIVGLGGTVGIAGTAEARLKFRTPSVTPAVNDVVKLFDSGGSVVAVGTITNYNDPYARISGKGYGTFTSVGIGTTQRVEFYQSDGTTFTGIASAISLADYTMFGAEMRSVGCAVEYGSQGVVADGTGVQLRLFATNFNHVGSGKDFTNDPTLVVQANEVIELNSGKISYVSIDQSGDFRVGDSLYINQETGQVSFASTTYDLENIGNFVVTDGGSNQTLITPTSLTVGNLQLASNTISSLSGDIIIDPAAENKTIITGDLDISAGNFTISGISTLTGNIDANGDLDVDGHTELDNVNISGIVTAFDLDVDGHTELDNVNVSGVSTFVGIVTTQDNLFVGNNLSVVGDVRVVGILTVGSGTITIDGDTNTISVGTGTTLDKTTIFANQLEVTGISTFKDKVVFDSTNSIQIPSGDTSQRDLSPVAGQIRYNSELSSFEGYGPGNAWGSLGGVKDVDQDTYILPETAAGSDEDTLYFYNAGSNTSTISPTTATLNVDLSVSGVSTFVGVSTFQDKVVFDSTGSIQVPKGTTGERPTGILGQIRYNTEQSTFEGFGAGNAWGSLGGVKDVDQDTYIIPEVSAGSDEDTLYFYNAGSNSATLTSTTATLNTDLSVSGELDVDGHTELDNVRITGVLTATSAEFSGNVIVGGTLTYEDVVNVDAIGIATARAGLRVTNGGLDVIGVSTFNDGANVASGNTYQINNIDVLSATTLGSGVVNSSLTSVGSGVISNRTELTSGQPSGDDYILLYDADAGDLKKATISNAALQGIQGTQGLQGLQGLQGTQGVQGIQGVQGTQGVQGVQGADGAQGIQGVQGTTGAQGTQGIQGTQGVQGVQGVQGTQGLQGTFGTQGIQGIQGVQGTTGTTGAQGTQGTFGTQGIQGILGTQGTTGAGTQGTAGSNGTQGASGSNGTQGATGSSGSAGPSNVINATNTTTNATYYPVFVAAAGSDQTPRVRTTATAFTFNASTGNLTAPGNVTAYSDRNIKTEIELIQNALEKVQQIRGVKYIRTDLDGDQKHIGLIAQEVEEVLPELVTYNHNGIMSLAYGNLTAVLVEAIKELKAEVDELRRKL